MKFVKTNLNDYIRFRINSEFTYNSYKGVEAFKKKYAGYIGDTFDCYIKQIDDNTFECQQHVFIFKVCKLMDWLGTMGNTNPLIESNIEVEV